MYVRRQNKSFVLLDLTNQEAGVIANLLNIGIQYTQLDIDTRRRLNNFVNEIVENINQNNIENKEGENANGSND